MIYVDFLSEKDGFITGFRVAGHSEYSETGSDIVCAAVSSAVYMAINTITDVISVTPLSMRVEEGEAFFRVELRDEQNCRTIFTGLRLHLQGLEEQYPEYIQVSYMEV